MLKLPPLAANFTRSLGDCRSGVAFLEFAFALPVVLALGLLGLETANYAMANLRVSNIAMLTADNAARVRDSIDEGDVAELFTGAKMSGNNINFAQNGRIILTDAPAGRFSAQGARWSLPNNATNLIFGGTLMRRVGASDIQSLTVAYFHPGCDCSEILMIGANVASNVRRRQRGSLMGTLDLDIGVGYGRGREHNYESLTLGAPLTLAFARPGHSRVAIFLNPRVGLAASSDVGFAPVVGGGVSWTLADGRSFQVAMNKVTVEHTVTNVGFAVTWRRRVSR